MRSLEQLIGCVGNRPTSQIELALTRAANSATASARQFGRTGNERKKRVLLEYAHRCDRILYYLHSGRFADDATYDDQELCRRIARLQGKSSPVASVRLPWSI